MMVVLIIAFTVLSKVILLPISAWIYKNSIKLVKIQPEINQAKIRNFGDNGAIAEEKMRLCKEVGYNPLLSLAPLFIQIVILILVISVIKELPIEGTMLDLVAAKEGGVTILIPVLAGLSAVFLCVGQNRLNVLQVEQSLANKIVTFVFSVGLSVYLGYFTQMGVVLYWICSNLLAVLQQYILNKIMKPEKEIDYKALEKTSKELTKLEEVVEKNRRSRELIWREKADYRRFFSIGNKHLVFYSESSGFYKYFRGTIEYILKKTDLNIHYITSDPNDQIFEIAGKQPQLKPYYIGERKLITLMMKMDADVVVMTIPDLGNYHIKRSYVRKDVEYVHIPHGVGSPNVMVRYRAFDNFDMFFANARHQAKEVAAIGRAHRVQGQKIIEVGYPLLDDMLSEFKKYKKPSNEREKILIAPSWQKENIFELCIGEILERLNGLDYDVVVRPHPQQVRHEPKRFEEMRNKYIGTNIEIQTDFSSNSVVFEADVMITDWSGIAYEYAFTTERPVIFIDTPMKVMNPKYKEIDLKPLDVVVRDKIGVRIKPEDVSESLVQTIQTVLDDKNAYREKIKKARNEEVYNLGVSAKVGAEYIIEIIQNKIKERKKHV